MQAPDAQNTRRSLLWKSVITDLIQIKTLGEKKQVENERFRKYLKRHNFPELKFRRIAEDIEDRTDCRACANCCKVAETDVTKRDAEKLAKFLGITLKQFIAEYTTTSAFEESDMILRRRETGERAGDSRENGPRPFHCFLPSSAV